MQNIYRAGFDIIRPLPGILGRVMMMKYKDPNMEAYWNSLSPQVQAKIDDAGIELCSLGMLMKLGDYYQNSQTGNSGEMPSMPSPPEIDR